MNTAGDHVTSIGWPSNGSTHPVPGQVKVHPHRVGDILDWEEAAASVGRNPPCAQRLPLPAAVGCGDPFCPALCPLAPPLHATHLPGGLPQASAQLAGARRHCLSVPRLHLLPADEWKSCLCPEDGLCKRVAGLVMHASYSHLKGEKKKHPTIHYPNCWCSRGSHPVNYSSLAFAQWVLQNVHWQHISANRFDCQLLVIVI